MKHFNVIIESSNQFKPYDIIPYLIECYKKQKDKPKTFEEFKKFIKSCGMYRWWSRCEYEIVLQSWPTGRLEQKIDVYQQLMMNIDLVVEIVMDEVKNDK